MSHYRHHVFVCANQRADGRPCCGAWDTQSLRDYLKQRIKALGLGGRGGARVSTAGCLGRCAEGPAIVVYPEAVWYRPASAADVEEILLEHLVGGRPVARLRLPD